MIGRLKMRLPGTQYRVSVPEGGQEISAMSIRMVAKKIRVLLPVPMCQPIR